MSPDQTAPALDLLAHRMAIDGLNVDSSAAAKELGKSADLFFSQGRIEDAAALYRKALSLSPDAVKYCDGLAAASLICADFETAIAEYRRVLQFDPDNSGAWCNLGHAYLFYGIFPQAHRCFLRALALRPGYADAHVGLAMLHLTLGHYKQGWRHYEHRPKANMALPEWQGEPLNGRRILLHAEQGLGDTLQFVRYIPLVVAQGGEVALQVQPPLRRFLAQLPDVAQWFSLGEPLTTLDCHCALPSLPRVFATDLSAIPAPVPYLAVPAAETAAWSRLVAGAGLKVGLAWAGSAKNNRDRHRSIPFSRLEALLNVPGVSFFSLQKGEAAVQLQNLPPDKHVFDLESHAQDFAETAAAISALDLIISVDTSIAHLAGALGKPAWILLPFVPDWRWLLDREDSPWYPTLRLFRQTRPGFWEQPISAAADALQRLVMHKP